MDCAMGAPILPKLPEFPGVRDGIIVSFLTSAAKRLLSPNPRPDRSAISAITSITGPTRNSSTRSHGEAGAQPPDYRKYVTLRIEALNDAIAGIIDIALKVKAQTYSFEAANLRDRHGYKSGKRQSSHRAQS
jgi:hypothetical protein